MEKLSIIIEKSQYPLLEDIIIDGLKAGYCELLIENEEFIIIKAIKELIISYDFLMGYYSTKDIESMV